MNRVIPGYEKANLREMRGVVSRRLSTAMHNLALSHPSPENLWNVGKWGISKDSGSGVEAIRIGGKGVPVSITLIPSTGEILVDGESFEACVAKQPNMEQFVIDRMSDCCTEIDAFMAQRSGPVEKIVQETQALSGATL